MSITIALEDELQREGRGGLFRLCEVFSMGKKLTLALALVALALGGLLPIGSAAAQLPAPIGHRQPTVADVPTKDSVRGTPISPVTPISPPPARPATHVPGADALRDNAFEVHPARMTEDGGPISSDRLAELDAVANRLYVAG